LATNVFHLFPTLKEFLGGRHFKSNEEVKDGFKQWLNGLAADVYDESIQKLVTVYDKCVNVGGYCVGKITFFFPPPPFFCATAPSGPGPSLS
jgi:hypothetical protein